jgi:hypothetical protein
LLDAFHSCPSSHRPQYADRDPLLIAALLTR